MEIFRSKKDNLKVKIFKPKHLTTGVAANLYIREYVPMGIDSLLFRSKSIPMGTF